MGKNIWRDENEWPLVRAKATSYYLHSDGKSNTLSGDGTLSTTPPRVEAADQFVCDPNHPVPELLHGNEKKVWGDAGYQGQTEAIYAAASEAQDMTSRRVKTKAGFVGAAFGKAISVLRECPNRP